MRLLLAVSVTPLILMGSISPGSLSSSPTQPPRLSGRVFAPNGKPQPAAVILAIEAPIDDGGNEEGNGSCSSKRTENDPRPKNRPMIRDTISDPLGQFYFFDLPPGRYVLLAIHGHHSPGRSAPVVVGELSSPFPLRINLDVCSPRII